MDGTFKTVPNILYQMYTIHGRIGHGRDAKFFPLLWALMSGKSEEDYLLLFDAVKGK